MKPPWLYDSPNSSINSWYARVKPPWLHDSSNSFINGWYPLTRHNIVNSTTSDSHPPHPMEHNSYRAMKCDAVDRILDFGSDLVYATVNAIIFLALHYKTYTNSALGFCGSTPTTTNPRVSVSSFASWSNVYVLTECLSGNANTTSGAITVESYSRSASLLSPDVDFNPSVTTCDDHSAAVGYCDTGGAAPYFALFTPVQKFYVASWSLMQSVIQLRIVCLPLMLASFILWHHPMAQLRGSSLP